MVNINQIIKEDQTPVNGKIIELEDHGKPLRFYVNHFGVIINAEPFNCLPWKGGIIQFRNLEVGRLCPIHNPPFVINKFLTFKVIKIIEIANINQYIN